ncbi:MAG TPA: hypothetical protein VGJ37_15760 [Pyrinomonadaceae bacterium]
MTVGNIVWRVFCELWVVLFAIHDELVSVRHSLNLNPLRAPIAEPVTRETIRDEEEVVTPRELVVHERDRTSARPAGVLGLS